MFGNPKIRLLAETTITESEPPMADGEENTWTSELVFEIRLPDERMFLTRSWFEASGHGESMSDGNAGGKEKIMIHGEETSPNQLTQCAMLLGWYENTTRAWVEITKEMVADAVEQWTWGGGDFAE
jgi:hypothetical protein